MNPYHHEDGIVLYNCDWRDLEPSILFSDLLLCDPPYGLSEAAGKNASRGKPFGSKKDGSRAKQLAYTTDYGNLDWDNEPPSKEDIDRLRSLTKHQIIFGGNYFHLPPSKCWLVWDKVNGESDFADCELAWTNLNKAVRKFTWMWNGMLKEQPEERFHPTQKPLALMKWCIKQAPDTVSFLVDPYAGSGTTLVAAKELGIKAVGVEREKSYCDIIVKRLRQGVFNFTTGG